MQNTTLVLTHTGGHQCQRLSLPAHLKLVCGHLQQIVWKKLAATDTF